MDEDLISLCLAADSQGAPTVTRMGRVINHLGDDHSDISNGGDANNNDGAPNKEEEDKQIPGDR